MQAEGQLNLEKLIEEQTKQIYDLYQSKSKSFQTTFRVLLSFALLFLFVILIPFISIKILNSTMSERQAALHQEISQRQMVIETYNNVGSAIRDLHSQLSHGAFSLREYIRSLPERSEQFSNLPQQSYSMPQLQSEGIASDQTDNKTWQHTQIQREVQRRFSEYQRILKDDVLAPLQAMNNNAIVVLDVAAIELGLDTLQSAFSNELQQNPEFWHTVMGKGATYNKLDESVNRFWNLHGSKIEHQLSLLNNEIDKLSDATNHLKRQLEELQKQEQEIGNRLSQIEFPFGKLPIGLNESIAVFPIILAIGFLMLALLLRDTIQLRKSYHRLYQRKDPTKAIVTDDQIMLIAPLWIDPLNSSQKNFIAWLILSLPALIFLVSCALILYSWTIPGLLRLGESLNWWLYGGMFLISLLLFIYGYRQLSKEMKRDQVNEK